MVVFDGSCARWVANARANAHPGGVRRPAPGTPIKARLPLALTPQQCASLKKLYLKTDLGIV